MKKQRLVRILSLSVPMVLAMLSQNLLTLVDTAMVGTQGSSALAALGLAAFSLYMGHALICGIATGVQTVVSRRRGEGDEVGQVESLNAALLLIFILGPFFSAVIYFITPSLFSILTDDLAVREIGIPYMQYVALASVFLGVNYCFRGYWIAVERPRVYFKILLLMHAGNIFLNYIFIFGRLGAPALGAPGAGLASLLAMSVGAALNIFVAYYALGRSYLKKIPTLMVVKTIVQFSLPNGIQQLLVAAGVLMLLWIVGRLGTNELAAANVLINIMLVAILPAMAFGLVTASLVGQRLGDKDSDDAHQWAVDVSRVALVFLAFIGLPMWLAPELVLSSFIHDDVTMALAVLPLRIMGITILLEAINFVFMNALLGAGETKRVMRVAVSAQWLVFLPLAYAVGPILGFGLLGIWVLQLVYRAGQSCVFAIFWQQRDWGSIKV